MSTFIRKISVGQDYKSNAMHYIQGAKVVGDCVISTIKRSQYGYEIWIQNPKGEILLWKHFNENMPISVEYNIDI
jgi:hypothetical protein